MPSKNCGMENQVSSFRPLPGKSMADSDRH
jgi:hypothetical protein